MSMSLLGYVATVPLEAGGCHGFLPFPSSSKIVPRHSQTMPNAAQALEPLLPSWVAHSTQEEAAAFRYVRHVSA